MSRQGRVISGKLVQGEDGFWREDKSKPKKPRANRDRFTLDELPTPGLPSIAAPGLPDSHLEPQC